MPASAHWALVHDCNGRSDEKVKEIILNEHTGMGVVAALVAAINVTVLLVKASDFLPSNTFNEAANACAVVLLYISLCECMYVVCIASDIYFNTL